MASEHYCHFLDRAVVDPFLALTWKQFDHKFGWGYSEWSSPADFLMQLALDPVPDDPKVVERILARRTLRWTLKHSSPQFFCLMELISHAPVVEKRCPGIELGRVAEMGMFQAAAVHGFLEDRITLPALWAVFAFTGWTGKFEWLDLPPEKKRTVQTALSASDLPKPIFPWQDESCLKGGYHPLGRADTQRFLGFLQLAWKETWPCTYLRPEAWPDLTAPGKRYPTVADSPAAQKLLQHGFAKQIRRPCLFRYYG